MSGREGIHLLIDIVAKGGNLLLNVAPGPDGTWQQGAYDLLESYGNWMDINAEGIYNSKPLAPYKENNICMTQQGDGATYFFYLAEEGESKIPEGNSNKISSPILKIKIDFIRFQEKAYVGKTR